MALKIERKDGQVFQRQALIGWSKGLVLPRQVEVGQLAGQRLPLLRKILRAQASDLSQKQLKQKALTWVGKNLAENEVLIFDAGAHISEVKSASVKREALASRTPIQ